MAAPTTVGIIANPASGKDIRRLVAYGTVFDNQEKVNIVRRVLLALSGTGVERVLYMPDYYGIVEKAVEGMRSQDSLRLEVAPLEMELTATQLDSSNAAAALAEVGAACIVTMGGDGTNRMVAKCCGDVPLLPISTGTNNVFPLFLDGISATIEFVNGMGEIETNNLAAASFVSKNYDMIIAIATPSAVAAYAAARDAQIPVVFSAVSDPVSAGLVRSLDFPDTGATGTTDTLNFDGQLKMIRAFLPEAKTISVLYTTSEANSISQIESLHGEGQQRVPTREAARERGG